MTFAENIPLLGESVKVATYLYYAWFLSVVVIQVAVDDEITQGT
jgi:hypothetical protein